MAKREISGDLDLVVCLCNGVVKSSITLLYPVVGGFLHRPLNEGQVPDHFMVEKVIVRNCQVTLLICLRGAP